MKRAVIILIAIVLLTSFASAEIIINTQPSGIYNLGDVINIPITIKSLGTTSGILNLNLICQNSEINFYKNGISLSLGEEKKIDPSLILTKNLIGPSLGTCIVKVILGSDSKATNEFEISDRIILTHQLKNTDISPGELIIIEGTSVKENGKKVNGFIDVEFFKGGAIESSSNFQGVVENGEFNLEVPTQENTPAGAYILKLRFYEKNTLDETTNQGISELPIYVKQTPKNLEIIVEPLEIEPNNIVKIKVILHDQTGQIIDATSNLEIKNGKGKVLERTEIQTNEVFEFQIAYNEPPSEFTITANSNGIEAGDFFSVKEKEDIEIQVINKTLVIKNVGNVPYCDKTVLIKIGSEALNIDTCLQVDEEKRYVISAPDGEYQIEIITDKEQVSESVALTGSAINLKEIGNAVELARRPYVWIFVIFILGFIATTIFRKGYKRSFIGGVYKKQSLTQNKISQPLKTGSIKKGPLFNSMVQATISLSIKGDKQDVSIVGLKIKNLADVLRNFDGVKEIIQRISSAAESKKAVVYENEDNIFFILAPIRTRTFKNEKNALKLAQEVKENLAYHNKLFKQKIDFGLSLNYGSIIAKYSQKGFEFMSLGNLLGLTKKISSISNGEILLSETMKEKLGTEVKVEKKPMEGLNAYTIRDVRGSSEESDKFIKGFLRRMER